MHAEGGIVPKRCWRGKWSVRCVERCLSYLQGGVRIDFLSRTPKKIQRSRAVRTPVRKNADAWRRRGEELKQSMVGNKTSYRFGSCRVTIVCKGICVFSIPLDDRKRSSKKVPVTYSWLIRFPFRIRFDRYFLVRLTTQIEFIRKSSLLFNTEIC